MMLKLPPTYCSSGWRRAQWRHIYLNCCFKGISLPLIVTNPDSELMDMTKYPSTLNVFAMPVQHFFFAVQAMAHRYRWRDLHIICDSSPGFHSYLCSQADANAEGQFSGQLKTTITHPTMTDNAQMTFNESLQIADSFRGENLTFDKITSHFSRKQILA